MESRGTHKEVIVNRPDITITNIKEKICMLTDVANQRTETSRKRERKQTKIQGLMYRDTTNVVTGDTGTVTEGLNKNLEAKPENHSTDPLQNTAALGTSRVTCRAPQPETFSLSGGYHRWFHRSAREKGL